MRHVKTGVIVPARCNSHLCPECSPLHQMTARFAIEQGIRRRFAEHRSERIVFATLTEPSKAGLDLPGLRVRWDRTRWSLQRKWGVRAYALVVEFQERGALHPHMFLEVPEQLAQDLADEKSRASYQRRMHELRPLAEGLGWGQMVHAVTVPASEDSKLARYAAKSLAGYTTKEAKERFGRAGAKHIRPVRLSYNWYGGGLSKAREHVLASKRMAAAKLEGPWERIAKVTC